MALNKDGIEIIEPKDVFIGPKNALVTLMEFGEYENEDCAKSHEVVKQIIDKYDGKIRFNFRHFPLTRIHQRSLKASEAAVAAAQHGKFWEMHDILFKNRRNLGTVSLKLYSKEAGITDRNFLDNLMNGTFGWQVQDDIREGLDRGVKTLPAFFVNDEPITLKPTFDNISKAIDSALRKARRKPARKSKA